MDPIAKSGYYYANKFSRIAILALEDVMGKNGVNSILNLANLPELINNYPPDNLERQFDFADFSAIQGALQAMYGPRGGRGLSLRQGRATFNDSLKNFGALAGVGDMAFKVLGLNAKMRIGLAAMAKIFSMQSDQISTNEEHADHFVYTIHRCPVCWGRHSDKPDCFIAAGLLLEGLKWVSGGNEFRCNESKCIATGDSVCEFIIYKEPIS